MKTVINTIFLILNFTILTAQNTDNSCEYISKELNEKPLECLNPSNISRTNQIFQIFKWSAFREDQLVSIEKSKNNFNVTVKKIYKSNYDQKTGNKRESLFETTHKLTLSKKQKRELKQLLKEVDFWNLDKYKINDNCTDGSGILIFGLKKNKFLITDNGNCQPKDEKLNEFYKKLMQILSI